MQLVYTALFNILKFDIYPLNHKLIGYLFAPNYIKFKVIVAFE